MGWSQGPVTGWGASSSVDLDLGEALCPVLGIQRRITLCVYRQSRPLSRAAGFSTQKWHRDVNVVGQGE